MSYQKYADDLLRTIPLATGTSMREVYQSLRTSDELLDTALATAGYTQNKSKQVTLFYIEGQRATDCKKHIREH
eukprot:3294310-Pyramimonas_sp.AAC.1